MKIGFIGLGVMGSSIVKHLMNAGHELYVYTRTKEKATDLLEEGANWCETPQKVTEKSETIMTMVGFPQDVEEVYFGENGIFSANITGKTLVDLTTSRPDLAEKIAKQAEKLGGNALDAPVSGGDIGAKNGTLTTMVGGCEKTFETLYETLMVFSQKVVLQGGPGCGQHTKMANQIMIAGTMTGMTEMLVYAKSAGLNVEKVIETVSFGSAANWSLTNYSPRIVKEDFAPGFYVKHFVKDLRIALESAEQMGIELPATQKAKELYEQLVEAGYGDLGTQSLIKLW